MGRLQPELLDRVVSFADRSVRLAEKLADDGRSRRVVDQIIVAGTSVGANTYEADEALSRADFAKCVGIVIKELNECRFWIAIVERRSWATSAQLSEIAAETAELKRIFGAILTRTRRSAIK
ncbi:MAG: four helix bundle protein [Phycisphaeraceae bacterium]|nr:MAG: four helix bundle protein [Phycisphaeraceae bacterium]